MLFAMKAVKLFAAVAVILIMTLMAVALKSAGMSFVYGVIAATLFWIVGTRLIYGFWLGDDMPPNGKPRTGTDRQTRR